jgi:hypothetical protein
MKSSKQMVFEARNEILRKLVKLYLNTSKNKGTSIIGSSSCLLNQTVRSSVARAYLAIE